MQDKEIKAGVVLVTRYTTPSNSSYQSYIDYMARDKASRQANAPKYVFPSQCLFIILSLLHITQILTYVSVGFFVDLRLHFLQCS